MVFVILTIFGFRHGHRFFIKIPESLTVTNRKVKSSGLKKTMFKNFKNIIEDATFCITNAHSRYDICNIIYIFLRLRLLFKFMA